ncbi:aspartic peptidase, partial [Tanacetum coccineum]
AKASFIKKLEVQLGKIAEIVQNRETGSLPSSTEINPRGLAHAITMRSGLNYKPPANPLVNNEDSNDAQDKHKNDGADDRNEVKEPEVQRKVVESYIPPIPFLGRLKKEKEKEQFRKFFKNLQHLSINIPFVEALEQMPKYAKFMKDLLTNKVKFEETSKVTLNERCSVILINEIPLKEKDLGSFTIPCAIGRIGTNKALADVGASISLMSYSMFVRLELDESKPTRMCIELANKSTQYPRGIAENVIIKIDKFVCHVDFVALDMEDDFRVLIILGRSFLATAHAMIDETLPKDQLDSFLFEPIKDCQPSKDINLWEDESEIAMDEEKLRNSLDSSTTPGLFSDLDDLEPDDFKNPTLFAASTTDEEKQILKLKELPSHLEYAFLDVQPQRRLNPKVQDVVKAEIVKLLDPGLIYAISDSPWISPIHVVPKKGA